MSWLFLLKVVILVFKTKVIWIMKKFKSLVKYTDISNYIDMINIKMY